MAGMAKKSQLAWSTVALRCVELPMVHLLPLCKHGRCRKFTHLLNVHNAPLLSSRCTSQHLWEPSVPVCLRQFPKSEVN
eukprot:9513-Pelagomonas_calceolata.AAC.4